MEPYKNHLPLDCIMSCDVTTKQLNWTDMLQFSLVYSV